ncbi:helix-turn-helix domain-containing protein [Pseudomonas sp. TH31]
MRLKQGKAKGFRLATFDAICKHLNCQPATC